VLFLLGGFFFYFLFWLSVLFWGLVDVVIVLFFVGGGGSVLCGLVVLALCGYRSWGGFCPTSLFWLFYSFVVSCLVGVFSPGCVLLGRSLVFFVGCFLFFFFVFFFFFFFLFFFFFIVYVSFPESFTPTWGLASFF